MELQIERVYSFQKLYKSLMIWKKNQMCLEDMPEKVIISTSDGTLQILSNNLVPKFQVFFNDLFPYSLTTLSFDATDTDVDYFTAEVSFKYTLYKIQDMNGNDL